MGSRGVQYRRPDVTWAIDRPASAVGAEHHRPIVVGFGDDRNGSSQLPPVVGGQIRQQLYDGPPGAGADKRPCRQPGAEGRQPAIRGPVQPRLVAGVLMAKRRGTLRGRSGERPE